MIWLRARYLTALSLTVLLYKKEVLISILQKHHGKRENPSMYLEQVLAHHCYGWYYYYSSFVKVVWTQLDTIADESLCPLGKHRYSVALIRENVKNGPSLRKPSAWNETAGTLDFPSITSSGGAGSPCVWDSSGDIWKSEQNRWRVCMVAATHDQLSNIWASLPSSWDACPV